RRRASRPASLAWSPVTPSGDERLGGGCEGVDGGAVVGPAPALLAGDEPGLDEQLHVVGDGGLGEPDGLGEVADAHLAVAAAGDHRHELDPGGVAERLEHLGQVVGDGVVDRLAEDAAGRGVGRGLDGGRSAHASILPHVLTSVDTRGRLDSSKNVYTWRLK